MIQSQDQIHLFGSVLKGTNDGFNEEPDYEAMARPRLMNLLAEAQAATRMPWDAQTARVNATLFHNMANWLPPSERDAMRAQFATELARLGHGEPARG